MTLPPAQVSVVLAAYEPGCYLESALRSVMGQSFESWEVIVVDDGSTENLAWVTSLDPRIRLLRQGNAGVSVARNRGIAQARGELVAFLDADDIWLPDKLDRQVRCFRSAPRVGLVSTDFETIDESGAVVDGGYRGHHAGYADLLGGNGICLSTVMVPRDVLHEVGGFRATYRSVHDWDLWLRIARRFPLGRVDEVLVQYRRHQSGLSSDWLRTYREACSLLRQHGSPHAGLARARDLGAHQAFDAARRSWRRRQLRGLLTALAFVARTKPSVIGNAVRARTSASRAGARP